MRCTPKQERTPDCSGATPVASCLTGQYHAPNSRTHVIQAVLEEVQKHFHFVVLMYFPIVTLMVLAVYVMITEGLAGDRAVSTVLHGDMVFSR